MNNERLNTMRSKIENVGLEDAGVDEGLVAEIIDELIDSRSQIATLTAERDRYKNLYHEAVVILEQIDKSNDESLEIGEESWERMKSMINDPDAVKIEDISLFEEGYNSRQPEIDSLTSELAALKSCPSMAEVDALRERWKLYEIGERGEIFKEALDIARRSISSREEVAG